MRRCRAQGGSRAQVRAHGARGASRAERAGMREAGGGGWWWRGEEEGSPFSSTGSGRGLGQQEAGQA
eukprot:442566-Rhodomonas_salina.4